MLNIHQPYIKKKKVKYFLALAGIGVLLLGSLIVVNNSSTSISVYAAGDSRTLSDIETMQDMTQQICSNSEDLETNNLLDSRGGVNNYYRVMKMSDDTCWMMENLRLGGTSAINLKSSDTDLNGALTSWDLPANRSGWNDSGNTEAMVRVGSTANLGSSYKEAYGNYYSWCAATAGTCSSATTSGAVAPSSICPKGWKLPAGTTGAQSFQNLYNQYPNNATAGWATNQTIPYNGSTSAGYSGLKLGNNSTNAFFPAAGHVYSSGLGYTGSYGYYWSRTALFSTYAYRLNFNSGNVDPQSNNARFNGFSVRCVAIGGLDKIEKPIWEESVNGNVNVNVPSILTIDAVSGMEEIADASKIIEGTATATISSNTEYIVTLHSTQPSLRDIENSTNTSEISPISSSNPVQPGNNAWGLWNGTTDPKTYTLPITTTPTEFPNTTEDTANTSGDPAKKYTYYVGISISPSLPSGTYGTDVTITASVK